MDTQFKQVEDDNSRITIQDVASALGISKTTVSRAISGKGRIGEETRNRVLSYIEKHNYQPNPLAKGLAQQRTYNIGWVMPGDSTITDLPFFQSCMTGVSEEAARYDYDVLLSLVYDYSLSGIERMVKGNKVDGIILGRTLVDDPNVAYLKASGVPFVVIGSTNESEVVQIDNDHVNACKELTSMLMIKGIRKIVLIGGNDNHIVNITRREGYELGIREFKGRNVESAVYMNSDNELSVVRIVENSIREGVECIVCMDDKICNMVLEVLRRENIRIPDDIKVASFYNSDILANSQPGISSLQYNPKELGAKACNTLISYINGEKVPMKTLLSYEVMLKGSTQ